MISPLGKAEIAEDYARSLKAFERCWPWLAASLEVSAYHHDGFIWPTNDKADVWARIASGRATLWPGSEGVFLTEFIFHASGLKSQNNWLAGGDLDEIAHMMPTIEDFARAHACHRSIGNGRRGWLRVFEGYTEYGVRKQKDLLAPGVALPPNAKLLACPRS
jgi:hypothetical protein